MFYTTVLSPTKPTLNLIDPKRSKGQDISLSARLVENNWVLARKSSSPESKMDT